MLYWFASGSKYSNIDNEREFRCWNVPRESMRSLRDSQFIAPVFLPLDLLNEFVDLGAIKALYKQDLSQHKNA